MQNSLNTIESIPSGLGNVATGLGSFFPSLGHGFAFIGDTVGGAIAGATNHKAAQAGYLAAADDHYNRQSDAEDTLTSTIQGLVPGSFYDLATAAGDTAGGQGGQARHTLQSMPGNYLNAWETDPASATLNTLPLLDGGGNIFNGLGSRLTEDGIANDVAGNTTRAAVSRGLGTGFTKVGGALKYTARGGPIGQLADHGSALLTSNVVKPVVAASGRAIVKAAPAVAVGIHLLKDADPVANARKFPSISTPRLTIPKPVLKTLEPSNPGSMASLMPAVPKPSIPKPGPSPAAESPPIIHQTATYKAPANAGAFSITDGKVANKPSGADPAHAWPDHILAASKGYEDVRVMPNGGPTFRVSPYLYPVNGLEENIVRIKLTGSRRGDFMKANALSGIKISAGAEAPDDYTWHHVGDYDPSTGMCTMELVRSDAHIGTYPHAGAVKYYVVHHNEKYKR